MLFLLVSFSSFNLLNPEEALNRSPEVLLRFKVFHRQKWSMSSYLHLQPAESAVNDRTQRKVRTAPQREMRAALRHGDMRGPDLQSAAKIVGRGSWQKHEHKENQPNKESTKLTQAKLHPPSEPRIGAPPKPKTGHPGASPAASPRHQHGTASNRRFGFTRASSVRGV